MHRRHYLATLGGVLTVGLAGCGNDNQPSTTTPTDTPTDTPSDNPNDWETAYQDALETEDIDVEFVEVNNRRLVIDYTSHEPDRAAFLREMETITTAYGEVVADTWTVEAAELWALDPDIEEAGQEELVSYLVQTEWARAWQANELSTNDLMEDVLETVEFYPAFRDRYGATPTPTDTINETQREPAGTANESSPETQE